MSRVKRGVAKHARHKRVLKLAKGYRASYSKLYRVAKQQTVRSGAYAFAHRRNFRKLWITRINAAARMNDISYSRLMNGLHNAGVTVNRKMLSEIAIADPAAFTGYVEIAKANLK